MSAADKTVVDSVVDAPVTEEPRSFRAAAISGAIWITVGYGSSQVIRLGGNLVLAWLLFPAAFGLMALVNVVIHGLTMFSDIGIGPSIIQNKRGATPAFLRTAWTIQIIRGFILWMATWALAWPVAALFSRNDPNAWQLLYLLPVAGFSAVIAGFNSPALFTLNRQLAFGTIARIEVGSLAIGVGVMIFWGVVAPSVWALVAGGMATIAAKMVMSHLIGRKSLGTTLRLELDRRSAHDLLHFGKWIFGSTLVTFLALNLDKAILGNLLALDLLGLYAIALVFARVAIQVTERLSAVVIFPILSKFQDDPARVVSLCTRSRRTVLWISGAVCAVFALAAPLFFEILYDQRYNQAGEIARWLTMYIWVAVLIASMDQIPLALATPRTLFFANLIKSFGILPAVAGYFIVGLPGFIGGMTLGWLVAHGYLILNIPRGRSRMLLQSFAFSAGWCAFILPAIYVLGLVATLGRLEEIVATLALAALPCGAAAAAVWRLEGKPQPSRLTSNPAVQVGAEPI